MDFSTFLFFPFDHGLVAGRASRALFRVTSFVHLFTFLITYLLSSFLLISKFDIMSAEYDNENGRYDGMCLPKNIPIDNDHSRQYSGRSTNLFCFSQLQTSLASLATAALPLAMSLGAIVLAAVRPMDVPMTGNLALSWIISLLYHLNQHTDIS